LFHIIFFICINHVIILCSIHIEGDTLVVLIYHQLKNVM